jgi:hypothetical protein
MDTGREAGNPAREIASRNEWSDIASKALQFATKHVRISMLL